MPSPVLVALRAPEATLADRAACGELAARPWSRPVDFVYDDTHGRLAVAGDVDGHPALAEALQIRAGGATARLAGGRFGRRADGVLATSEWSGRFGEFWDDATRASFVATMAAADLAVVHRVWHAAQTADEVG